jgi:hypothetical protein
LLVCAWAGRAHADPVLRVVPPGADATNLLSNPDFEASTAGQFAGWQGAPQGFRVAPGEGRSGSQALAVEALSDASWFGASQTLRLDRTNPVPVRVRGWSRAEGVSGASDSNYALYVDIVYQDGTPLWGQTGNYRAGTHDWEEREFVILPE